MANQFDVNKFIESVSELSVIQLNELVDAIAEKFGVSKDVPVMAAAGGNQGGAADEKSSFDVILKSAGGTKMAVIKAVKALAGLGLKEAKELVDSAPKEIKKDVAKDEAEKMKEELEKAGATVELK